MKLLSRTTFILYLLILLWLLLFKFSYDIVSVLLHYQTRSLNLIPFVTISHSTIREMIDNAIVFIPFGTLLSINYKQATFRQRVASIFLFSVVIEIIQCIFAIGVTDTTDVIMNTGGGLIGVGIYETSKKIVGVKITDRWFVILTALLLLLLIYIRIFVVKVRY